MKTNKNGRFMANKFDIVCTWWYTYQNNDMNVKRPDRLFRYIVGGTRNKKKSISVKFVDMLFRKMLNYICYVITWSAL